MTDHAPLTPAEEVRAIRASLGLSQTALAAALGTNQSRISDWERGDNRPTPYCLMVLRYWYELRQVRPLPQPPGLRRFLPA